MGLSDKLNNYPSKSIATTSASRLWRRSTEARTSARSSALVVPSRLANSRRASLAISSYDSSRATSKSARAGRPTTHRSTVPRRPSPRRGLRGFPCALEPLPDFHAEIGRLAGQLMDQKQSALRRCLTHMRTVSPKKLRATLVSFCAWLGVVVRGSVERVPCTGSCHFHSNRAMAQTALI